MPIVFIRSASAAVKESSRSRSVPTSLTGVSATVGELLEAEKSAGPPGEGPPEACIDHAQRTARLVGIAAEHNNAGIRSFYHAIAAIAWFHRDQLRASRP